jgi:hypothetical protein
MRRPGIRCFPEQESWNINCLILIPYCLARGREAEGSSGNLRGGIGCPAFTGAASVGRMQSAMLAAWPFHDANELVSSIARDLRERAGLHPPYGCVMPDLSCRPSASVPANASDIMLYNNVWPVAAVYPTGEGSGGSKQ